MELSLANQQHIGIHIHTVPRLWLSNSVSLKAGILYKRLTRAGYTFRIFQYYIWTYLYSDMWGNVCDVQWMKVSYNTFLLYYWRILYGWLHKTTFIMKPWQHQYLQETLLFFVLLIYLKHKRKICLLPFKTYSMTRIICTGYYK